MSIVNALSKLKSNLFGGPGNTGFSKPPPSKVGDINMTKTPVSSLDSDPLKFGTYQYPKDVFENGQLGHYMVFYVNKRTQSKYEYGKAGAVEYSQNIVDEFHIDKYGSKSANARIKVKNNKITGGSVSRNNPKLDLSKSKRNKNSLTGLAAANPTTRRISDSIALYLPANVTDSTVARYEDMNTGLVGKALGDAANLVSAVRQKDYDTIGKNVTGALSEFAKEALRRLAAGAAEGLLGAEGFVEGTNKLFGQADNPFIEVMFTSMGIRKFTYNFIFAPRNEAETIEVQQIIQLFRFHMAPELQGKNMRYLTLPSEFDIHYMYKANDGQSYENDYFTRLSTCVLQGCDVNYTPESKVRTFEDGAPTQVTMTLTFSETEALTKEKINEGY